MIDWSVCFLANSRHCIPLICFTASLLHPAFALKPPVAQTASHRPRCYTGVSCLLVSKCTVGVQEGRLLGEIVSSADKTIVGLSNLIFSLMRREGQA